MTDRDTPDEEVYGTPRLEPIYNFFQRLAEAGGYESVSEMADDVEAKRFEYQPEEGIYHHAEIEAPDGGVFSLSEVYFWSTRMDGDRLVDVPEEQLPDGVEIDECRLTVFGSDGTPLFGGSLADEGNETLGEKRCLQVEQ